ncbi:MAG TPA: MarR family transcriptional regulator [Candidatus Limnocylindrales bacterium]|jgi:DNA-binding MarR family transcriptional regulator|nr:MarR family transcriptional regulator [Candidatus Limnocylindrales bacterium]
MSLRTKPNSPLTIPLEDQIFVVLLRAADSLASQGDQLMKANGVTSAQYNVLRILRGAGPEGLPCNAIGERMISRDPDMTRLLDRMEKRALISRERQKEDRRVVKARITDDGLKLLKRMDAPIRELHKGQFAHMTSARLKTLMDLLTEVVAYRPK